MRPSALRSAVPCALAMSLVPLAHTGDAVHAVSLLGNSNPAVVAASSIMMGPPYVEFVPSVNSLTVGQKVTTRPKLGQDPAFNDWWWGTQVQMTSSNPSVVTVTETGFGTGIVATLTAMAPGTAIITGTTQSNTRGTMQVQVTGGGITGGHVAQLRIACANGQYCDAKAGAAAVKSVTGSTNQLTVVALDSAGHVLWTQPYTP
jgi:hypothetical protein